VTSPNPDGPTVVDMGVFVDSLDSIDESENTYAVDGFIDLIWCNSRLKFDAEEAGTPSEIYLEKDAEDMLGEMWWPDLAFKHETKPHQLKNVELTLHEDGTMEYRASFAATIGTDFELKAFPFDHQQLHLVIDSFTWASDALVFRQQKNMVGFSDDFSIPEWRLVDVEEEVGSKKEIRDRREFSTFTVNMNIDRDPGVYLTKVIFPLAAIVLLNMVVLWMRPDEFEARFGAAMSGLLAAVAYQFIASGHLPRHVYNTYVDAFVGLSFFTLLLIIAESGWPSESCTTASNTPNTSPGSPSPCSTSAPPSCSTSSTSACDLSILMAHVDRNS